MPALHQRVGPWTNSLPSLILDAVTFVQPPDERLLRRSVMTDDVGPWRHMIYAPAFPHSQQNQQYLCCLPSLWLHLDMLVHGPISVLSASSLSIWRSVSSDATRNGQHANSSRRHGNGHLNASWQAQDLHGIKPGGLAANGQRVEIGRKVPDAIHPAEEAYYGDRRFRSPEPVDRGS